MVVRGITRKGTREAILAAVAWAIRLAACGSVRKMIQDATCTVARTAILSAICAVAPEAACGTTGEITCGIARRMTCGGTWRARRRATCGTIYGAMSGCAGRDRPALATVETPVGTCLWQSTRSPLCGSTNGLPSDGLVLWGGVGCEAEVRNWQQS